MIARRQFVLTAFAVALAASTASPARAQGKLPRIGLLISETLANEAYRVDALRAGLREHGWAEGTNLAIEIRAADGNYERLPQLAVELAALRVDVIVAFGSKALSALTRATRTVPIVDPVMGDPEALGLGGSLARPQGNVTGLVSFSAESYAKRLELLNEAVPGAARVALLVNPANSSTQRQLHEVRGTAKALNLKLAVLECRSAGDIREALSGTQRQRVDAIVVSSDTLFRANAETILELALAQRIPVAGTRELGLAGALIGYGPDPAALFRRGAYLVDRLLKGAKPADLPIERATRIDLVVNLRTAKALGIAVPQSLLVRADDVIR